MTWLVPFLPDGLAAGAAALLLGASFAGSFITVAFGIGGGAFLLAIMATLVPPAALIPTHGVIQIGSNLGRAVVTLRHVVWTMFPAFVAGSILGAGAGGMIAVSLPPAAVQLGVGLFIVWSVLGRPPKGVRDWPFTVGAVSSFLTMFFGATGPFVATFVRSHHLPRHGHVATHAGLMVVQHGVKTAAFGLLGFAFADWAWLVAAMIAAGFLGTLAGGQVLNRMSDARFRRALDVVLLLLAARLIWGGVRGL
ncbi:sulfite exporter TauE/SafE family protein [Wenxinia marina]|uniref:Probable membrane transporter protein n=1 Tax=Wenxinia marina DSM 24838 TaxID=1123501 RepID=A0A0D0PEL1_9RHOB|nr:sulfite exporter TauE/SafE family protein [Wenxinia marina]KIQ69841.1 Sulfite exporter TauE/SafE [Wenxinia marina DSM 24838]GGL61648.1 hypothetical protein GCM10011392_15130 [Wenxinia marina]